MRIIFTVLKLIKKMTQALAYLGLWDEHEVQIKEVNANNRKFIELILQSEEKMAIWEGVTP